MSIWRASWSLEARRRKGATILAILMVSVSGSTEAALALERQEPSEEEEQRDRNAQFFADAAKRAFDAGHFAEAAATYSRVLRFKPGDARVYFNRGNAYRKEGDIARALQDYNDAIVRDPTLLVALINR
ncbi:MAG: tetratricopeptide repeat protein, partial [Hyphomicrobium sp.]|nr:tetratricopeptide repeat protein [Hyphomicrobium sp.]